MMIMMMMMTVPRLKKQFVVYRSVSVGEKINGNNFITIRVCGR